MKNYFIQDEGSTLIEVNGYENGKLDLKLHERIYADIDWAWLAPEDGIVNYNDKEYPVKANDIIFKLYRKWDGSGCRLASDIIIVSNDAWVKHIIKAKESEKASQDACESVSPKMSSKPLAGVAEDLDCEIAAEEPMTNEAV